MTSVDSMRFVCGGCGYRARIPTTYQNKVILCPGCQQMQIADGNAEGSAPTGDTVRYNRVATAHGTDRFSKPDDAGRLTFTCSSCAFSAKLAAIYAGKAISCPKCQSPQLIPPIEPAGGAPMGKTQPPRVESPAADVKEDELTFDLSPSATKPESAAMPIQPSKSTKPPAPSSVPEADELTFDDAPVASAPSAPSAPKPPMPRVAASKSSTSPAHNQPADEQRPGTGQIKRRGSRMPLPNVEPDLDEVEAEVPMVEKKPLPPWVEQAKQPKIMIMAGSAVVLLVLMVVLISGWMSATDLATEQRALAASNKSETEREIKARKEVEWKLSETETALTKAKQAEIDAKAALVAAEMKALELAEKFKQVDSERQGEYDKRKKAEASYDEVFAKIKSFEATREEDYRIRNDLRKKYDEESRLRREMKIQFDDTKIQLEEALKRRK